MASNSLGPTQISLSSGYARLGSNNANFRLGFMDPFYDSRKEFYKNTFWLTVTASIEAKYYSMIVR